MNKIKLTNTQFILLCFSLISVLVSIILTYNQVLINKGCKPLFENDYALHISRINKTFIFLLLISFLVINYEFKYYVEENENTNFQIIASWLTVIAGFISLYVEFKNNKDNFTDIENPTI